MSAGQTLCVHSPGGSTFLREMTSCRHLESVTLNRKSDFVNRCVFTRRTISCHISFWSDLKRRSLLVFSARQHICAQYAIAHPSVCLSHGWISQRRLKVRSRNLHHRVAPWLLVSWRLT